MPQVPESEELVDVFDGGMNRIGTVTRKEAHEKSLKHMSVRVWLLLGGKLVFQRRSAAKKLFPGKLDPACTGHVCSGETPQAAALREIWEETGVRTDANELLCAGAMPFRFRRPGGILDDEFAVLFVWQPESSPPLRATDEVSGWELVSPGDYGKIISGMTPGAACPFRRSSFCCPDPDEWARVSAIMAESMAR